MTVPSFAVDSLDEAGNKGIYVGDCSYYGEQTIDGETESYGVIRTSETFAGKDCFKFVGPQTSGSNKNIIIFNIDDFNMNHQYTVNFDYNVAYSTYTNLLVWLIFESPSGDTLGTQLLYYQPSPSDNLNNQWRNLEFSFTPDETIVNGSGYRIKFVIDFQFNIAYSNSCRLGSYIYLNDDDVNDTESLLDSILNWLSRIYHSIAGGVDREGVNHTGIVQGIVNGLTTLGNRIGNFFADLKQGFIDKLESVKTAITNAIDGIEQWFIDLKDNIINGLKSLFIPSEGYFAQKKDELEQFMTDHFGAVWQGPGIMLDFVRALLTIEPSDNPQLVMPAIEFEFNGQTWHLSDPITYSFSWVNDTSHPLHYFYLFYMGFVTLILVILFINYLKRKFDIILGMREE